jgi:competence protein ComEC
MAYPQSAYFRQPQGDRRLAPAQIAAFSIAAFLTGIVFAGSGVSSAISLFAAFATGAGIFAWKRSWLAAVLIPLTCLTAIFYYHLYFTLRATRAAVPFDRPASFSGIVAAEPGHSAKSEYFPLRLELPFRGRIQVIVPPGSGFRYGDQLEFQGRIRAPENEIDLPASIFPKTTLIDRGRGSFIRQTLSDFKYELLEIFPRYLPAAEAAFLGGITLGAKASFSPEFTSALAASGTTHLVALSGYNIAILVFVVFNGCLWTFGRRPSFYITIAAILVFVVMVGAEPSVVRAAGMAFVVLLARELGRPYGLQHAILWTAFFMVLFDPASLFMAGFQLSFMSLLGIVYLSPLILKRVVFLGVFRENAALTISAQLAVAPIALHNFGGVSLTSFLANALILPFMPITMLFGFVLIACGYIFPPLGFLTGMAVHILLAYEIAVIRFFAEFSLPIKGTLPAFGILIYYLALIIFIRHHQLQEDEG